MLASSHNPSNQHQLLPTWVGILLMVLIFGGAISFLIYQKIASRQIQKTLNDTVFAGYFGAVQAGRLDEAWEKYTTNQYKLRYPLARYKSHYQELFQKFGRLTGVTPIGSVGQSYGLWGTFKGKRETTLYNLYFEKSYVPTYKTITNITFAPGSYKGATVSYTLAPGVDGLYRIDGAAEPLPATLGIDGGGLGETDAW